MGELIYYDKYCTGEVFEMKVQYNLNFSNPFLDGKYSKVLLIFGFILIIHNFFILYFHQPGGYVIDIYSTLPLSFYCASILCYLISSLVLLFDRGISEKFGILLLILNHVTILLIPFMLGYYSMGRGDDMWYLGEYLHISKSGSISGWDIYPGSLVLGAILSIILDLPSNCVSFVVPVIFSFIFIGGMCLCCRFFLKDDMLVNLAVLSSFILYLGPYNFSNTPHALFFAYIPLFIFILGKYIKKIDIANTVLVAIPIVLTPFMHPYIVFFVVALLLVLILFGKVLSRFIHGCYRCATSLLIIVFIAFLSWFMYCNTLLGSFRRSYQSYIWGTTEPVLFETTEQLVRINIDPFKMTKLLLVYYGRYFIPLLVIVIAIILIYLKRDKISQILKDRVSFFLMFYVMFFVTMVILFLNPIFSHQSDRMTNLNFMVYAQVPLFVLSLSIVFERLKSFNHNKVLVFILLVGIWGLSLFGTFNSPNIFRMNVAITHNEVEGMKWFYDVRDSENIITPLTQTERFHELFDNGGSDNYISISDHFGYNSSCRSFKNINLECNRQSYVVLLTVDELLYQRVPGYMEVGRYTSEDFVRFRNDPSVSTKLYDNQDIEIFDVKAYESLLDSLYYNI